MDKVKKIGIPVVLIGLIIGLLAITYSSYVKKQSILFSECLPLTEKEILIAHEVEVTNNQIKTDLTNKELDSLLLKMFQGLNEEDPSLSSIQAVHYDMAEELLYLGVMDNESKYYTFKVKAPLEINEEGIKFELKKFRLGRFYVPVTRGYFKKATGFDREIQLTNADKDLVVKIQALELVEGQIIATYTYDEAVLKEKFEGYTQYIENSRVIAHANKKDIDELFIKIGQTKKIDLETIKACLNLFTTNNEGIKAFSFIMNTEGQKAIYNDWHYLFINGMTLEEWCMLSENDMAGALDEYHNTFAKSLYAYLYNHYDYRLDNGTIKINNTPVNYQSVLAEAGHNNFVYDIDLVVEDQKVYAVYKVSDGTVKKQVLVRR